MANYQQCAQDTNYSQKMRKDPNMDTQIYNKRSHVNFDDGLHLNNVNRRLMERDNMFNVNTTKYKTNKNFSEIGSNVGEITGVSYENNEIEQGMPMRQAICSMKEGKCSLVENDYNPQLDFDLRDEQPTSNANVSYFDPGEQNTNFNHQYSDLDNFGHEILQDDIYGNKKKYSETSEEIYSSTINEFSWSLISVFRKLLPNNSSITISPQNIMNSIIMLYRGSADRTEHEIKSVLSLPDKDTLFKSAIINNQKFNNDFIFSTNLIFVSNKYKLNRNYLHFAKQLGIISRMNVSAPQQEANRINSIIKKLTKNTIQNTVSPELINGAKIISINTIFIKTKWKHGFSKSHTQSEQFYGVSQRSEQIMRLANGDFNYIEDNLNQVLEMDFACGEFTMGFVLPKNYSVPSVSNSQFKYYTNNMRRQRIKAVSIPKFTQKGKFKIDNVFKKLGIVWLFSNANLDDIVMSENESPIHVTAMMHQSMIIVDELGSNLKKREENIPRRGEDDVMFVANHPFIYYVKHLETNAVVFIGYYN